MIHSFLLIGQSNMAGRGSLNNPPRVECDRIKILRNGRWQGLFRPINPDRSFSGFSLAESFAESYSKEFNVDVGLICCADGGTCLDQWREGSLLFDNAVYNARLAERTSTIAGVLWHQGEADCSLERYPLYSEKFERIMKAFRRELNLYDVPFLLGGLGDFLPERKESPNMANYTFVNRQLENIAKNNPLTAFVSAAGLTSNADNLHFNAESLYEFGKRYFEAFKATYDKSKVFTEKAHEDNALRTEMELL